jgi:hypothetical protein
VRQRRELLPEEKDIREGRGGASGGENRGECEAPTQRGAEDFHCSGDSTGIRLRSNNKLIRQSLSQIAKTDGTTSVVAANLAMKEHQGQGERQNANHGEHDQCLAAALMHRFLRWPSVVMV